MSDQNLSQTSADLIKITIILQKLTNLLSHYGSSEFTLKVEFGEQSLLETATKPLCDDVDLEETINLQFDPTNYQDYDKILSNPLIITVYEHILQEENKIEIVESGKAQWRSEVSIEDLQEALFGNITTENGEVKETKKNRKSSESKDKKLKTDSGSKNSKLSKNGKGSKSSKISKDSKGSKASNKTGKIKLPDAKNHTTRISGTIDVDLISLLEGETLIKQSCILNIEPNEILDDRLKSIANLPRIDLEINLDKKIPPGKIINISLESIFNLPQVLSPSMKYQTELELPITRKQNINFNHYLYEETSRKKYQRKKWFGNYKDSDYYLEDSYDNISSKFKEPINEVLQKDHPRLEFNVIKRIYLSEEDIDDLKIQIVKHQCLPLEMYIAKEPSKKPSTSTLKSKNAAKDNESKTNSKKGKTRQLNDEPAESITEDFLHLMAYIDVHKLLYPGQKRQRVACQLRTFNHEEFVTSTGSKNSYFKPKLPPKIESVEVIVPKEKVSKGKTSAKKDGSKKTDSLKESKVKGGSLKSKLPKEPPPPEASQGVFNENGLPTFIIVDVELQESFVPLRDLKDISDELSLILDEGVDDSPKNIKSSDVTRELYANTITSVIRDIKYQYCDYLEEAKKGEIDEKNFLKYLQIKGVYQTYLASISRGATTYINSSFDYNPYFSTVEYQGFIANIYTDLIEKMNKVIYKLFNTTVEHGKSKQADQDINFADYAFEALELNAYDLSSRYFVQNIISDDKNPDNWFNFAIYHMHINEHEKAVECTLEALKINKSHPNSLLLYSLLLAKKNRIPAAETCLLNVLLEDPTWVEGWGALYCIYQLGNNLDGSEVALETGAKCLKKRPPPQLKDLSWNPSCVPKTLFYRTACFFISLRLYDEAELMISSEIFRANDSTSEYLRAVISYYKRDFDHALIHIDNAISIGGNDSDKNILRGHILLGKDEPGCALEEYAKISYQFSQPEESDKYFLYIQEGLCYSRLGEGQKARINFLQACKIRGSPYAWLCTGVLFYYQMDFISAEQCFTQANSLDSLMPEIWAYLCLVNIAYRRQHEADICYQQMVKNRLWNPELEAMVEEALGNFNEECNEEKK